VLLCRPPLRAARIIVESSPAESPTACTRPIEARFHNTRRSPKRTATGIITRSRRLRDAASFPALEHPVAETDDILRAAGNLGALIATNPIVTAYRETIRQLDLDVGAKTLLQQYEQLIEVLSMKEAQMQPIEVAEKKQFEQLQQSIIMNATLKKFAKVQQDYMDLMKKVQEQINAGMTGKIEGASAETPAAATAAPSKIILDT
jgi:cell fate (sporulation/competence/biofilm development) regulator YlbF (YheA/YmcA/DUF963 family)